MINTVKKVLKMVYPDHEDLWNLTSTTETRRKLLGGKRKQSLCDILDSWFYKLQKCKFQSNCDIILQWIFTCTFRIFQWIIHTRQFQLSSVNLYKSSNYEFYYQRIFYDWKSVRWSFEYSHEASTSLWISRGPRNKTERGTIDKDLISDSFRGIKFSLCQ